jgi:hypothetical protein
MNTDQKLLAEAYSKVLKEDNYDTYDYTPEPISPESSKLNPEQIKRIDVEIGSDLARFFKNAEEVSKMLEYIKTEPKKAYSYFKISLPNVSEKIYQIVFKQHA